MDMDLGVLLISLQQLQEAALLESRCKKAFGLQLGFSCKADDLSATLRAVSEVTRPPSFNLPPLPLSLAMLWSMDEGSIIEGTFHLNYLET